MNEHKTRRMALGVLGGVLLLGGAVGVAVATGVPTSSPLVWGGTVTDDAGKPYDKAVEVSVAFYDGQAATTPVCESKVVNAEAKTGRFSVVLPDACAKAVHDSPDLWSETVVGPSKTKLPRVKVAAVPYALEAAVAGVAEKAGGALASEISGLSGKVDGLDKDVAALKGASGGGGAAGTVWLVKDANGVTVGTFLGFADSGDSLSVVTASGYVLILKLQAPFSPAVYFTGSGCTGDPYVYEGYGSTGRAFVVLENGKQRQFRATGGSAKNSLKPLSIFNSNGCVSFGNLTSNLVAIEEVTAAELGIPTTIAYSLKLAAAK
ncbi:MAG: hypothetical protein H6747_09445 [Deltaproteobacteria bacterium]|nr:hypothetical protein [Deltaproteobacteria bacterium]